MAYNNPNLVDSTERLDLGDGNSNFSEDDEIRPNLIGETTTDLKLNLLANQMKITYHNSDTEKKEQSTVTEETPPNDNFSITSDDSPKQSPIQSPVHVKRSPPPVKIRNPANDRFRKVELLRIFQELEKKGINISSKYSLSSDLEEMEQEYEILKSIQTKKNAVKLYSGFLLNSVQAMEFLNESYNPFDFQLKGWSEYFNAGIDDYEDVLEEIYEKYKDTGKKIEPEIKLMLMLVTSATSFHASNTLLKDTPGLDSMIKNNPNFINNLAKGMVKDPPKNIVPPEFVSSTRISGPDPKEFLKKMRESQNARKVTPPPPPPIDTRNDDFNISEVVTSTSKRKKKKGITINI